MYGRPQAWVLVALSLVSLSGCRGVASVRFANEYDCPMERVTQSRLGGGLYRVTGCGRVVDYVCLEGLCDLEREGAHEPSRRGEIPPVDIVLPGSTLRVFAAEEADGYRIEHLPVSGDACDEVQFRQGSASLRLEATGASRSQPHRAFRIPGTHLRRIVAGSETSIELCGQEHSLAPAERDALRELMVSADPELAPASPATAPASPASPPSPTEEPPSPPSTSTSTPSEESEDSAALRSALDDQAPVVLACVAQPLVALRVTWSAGEAQVSLQGAQAGTPEEGCIRAALGDGLRAPEGSGELLHVVRQASE